MIYCFTGEGKGKTSAALGVSVRMLCLKKRVLWVSWYKNADWDISEGKLVEKFPDLLTMIWAGKGFYFKNSRNKELENSRQVGKSRVYDFDTPGGHRKSAEDALGIISDTYSGYDLVVMDEVLNAIGDGLISETDLLKVLAKCKRVHVVLTGRGISEKLIKNVDLVSDVRKIKHPFDEGVLAIKGLDF